METFSRPFEGRVLYMFGGPRSMLNPRKLSEGVVNICSSYSLSERQNEDVNYLFIHCTFTKQISDFILIIMGIDWTMPRITKELMQCWYMNGLGEVKIRHGTHFLQPPGGSF